MGAIQKTRALPWDRNCMLLFLSCSALNAIKQLTRLPVRGDNSDMNGTVQALQHAKASGLLTSLRTPTDSEPTVDFVETSVEFMSSFYSAVTRHSSLSDTPQSQKHLPTMVQ